MKNGGQRPGLIYGDGRFEVLRSFDIKISKKILRRINKFFLEEENVAGEEFLKSSFPIGKKIFKGILVNSNICSKNWDCNELEETYAIDEIGIKRNLSYEEISKFLESRDNLFLGIGGLFIIFDYVLNELNKEKKNPLTNGFCYIIPCKEETGTWKDSYGRIALPYIFFSYSGQIVDFNLVDSNYPLLGSRFRILSFSNKGE